MFNRLRKRWEPDGRRSSDPPSRPDEPPGRRPGGKRPNLFEAAAAYIAACAENDPDRSAEAARWVSPEALSFGVNELACRAVVALARERGAPPQAVARSLLGLPGV
ncbi:hypothetical protein I5Q34_23695 [Streptomyces sp. AV19]|uniref:hypothetical protein n=1 Tax=Streptomyces sp. AV19 TaxID=2793068 RepID=UPI0018FE4049|nr:hypothetical protein [Streptomyces sp. AV19]MBH1937234.1 hypothetical protein [Streptomyces sp. AV19]MDG4536710.1 hypothetical protein [Streptomyces sp. AV19]